MNYVKQHEQGQYTPQSVRRLRLERKIEALLSLQAMTARDMQRQLYGVTSDELRTILESMVKIGSISEQKVGKKILYLIFSEEGENA
jgi:hypothetical protein